MGKKKATTRATIAVENVNVPGRSHSVDAIKYGAMKTALLAVLPRLSPGMTQKEMGQAVLPHLPDESFPGGEKAMWWLKTVQLDLEAKGIIKRESSSKPLRWYRLK
jgi:hypothetical protein